MEKHDNNQDTAMTRASKKFKIVSPKLSLQKCDQRKWLIGALVIPI